MLRRGHSPAPDLPWLLVASSCPQPTYCQVGCGHGLGGGGAFDAAHVGQAVLVVVPAPVGQVDATHEGHGLVHDHQLLMVGPQVHRGGHMVWVPHHL